MRLFFGVECIFEKITEIGKNCEKICEMFLYLYCAPSAKNTNLGIWELDGTRRR